MIRVVRIAGESYDLESGEELPKALVLSNGVREFSLHVDDMTAQAVVEMMAESQALRNQNTISKTSTVKVPSNGGTPAQTVSSPPTPEPALQKLGSIIVDDLPEDVPADEPEDEEVYEPGEEYSDPTTGVSSL